MPIAIESQPNPWSLNRNGVGWRLSSDNENIVNGVKAVLQVDWNLASYPVDGEQFTFSWDSGNQSITFTFRSAPDDSGEEVLLDNTSPGEFLIALKESLERNWRLKSAFTITSTVLGGNIIQLTAKDFGSKYNPAFSESTSASATTSLTSGVDQVPRSNFRIFLEIDMWSVSAPAVVDSVRLESTLIDGEADFDVSNILDSGVRLNQFPPTTDTMLNVSGSAIQYRVRWAEKYGSPAEIKRLSSPLTYKALIGGFSRSRSATEGLQDWVDSGLFLTNLNERRISRTQLEVLHFIDSTGVLTSHAEVFYTDGTSEVVNLLTAPTSSVDTIWCIPFNYQLVATSANPVKTIAYWEVFLSKNNPGTPISNRVRYELRDEFEIDSTQLIFRNSFGVYETIECHGAAVYKLSNQREVARKDLPRGASYSESAAITTLTTIRTSKEVSTGWLSRLEMEWVQELILSREVFEVNGSNEFNPVLIEIEEFEKYSSQSDELNSMVFKVIADIDEVGN